MRIAIDLHDIHRTGGLEKVVAGIAVQMAMRGHQVTAFTYASPAERPTFPVPQNLDVRHYTFTGDAETVPVLRAELTSIDPDVFVSPSSFNNILFWAAVLRGTGIPLLYSEHSNPWRIEEERWNKAERQAVLWAADAIHLLVHPFLDSVPLGLRGKCCVIGNPVSLAPTTAPGSHPPCLLSLGRFDKVKQIPLLVQAFALLSPDFPQWELHIWGAGGDEPAIRKTISAASCPQIHLHGLTLQPAQQFSQADIFCIPSRFEGFPLTVVEAFTHGLPVVGFAECSGVNSLVRSGHNGLLADAMTAESLAASLRQLMADPDLRHSMGRNARQDARTFAPSAIYDQWEQLLQKTAACKGHTRLQLLDAPQSLGKEEDAWRVCMRSLCARKNLLLRDSQWLRRFIWRRPRLKAWLKRLLRKA